MRHVFSPSGKRLRPSLFSCHGDIFHSLSLVSLSVTSKCSIFRPFYSIYGMYYFKVLNPKCIESPMEKIWFFVSKFNCYFYYDSLLVTRKLYNYPVILELQLTSKIVMIYITQSLAVYFSTPSCRSSICSIHALGSVSFYSRCWCENVASLLQWRPQTKRTPR